MALQKGICRVHDTLTVALPAQKKKIRRDPITNKTFGASAFRARRRHS